MSQVPSFPSDVWRLVETKTMEPLGFVDRVEVTDPEGTAFGYDVDEAGAKGWAAGVYQQGHLFMFPAQATGRFPYSVIEYPAMGGSYMPPVQPEVTGIIASTTSHAASHPRIEIKVTQGRHLRDQGRRPLWRGHAAVAELSRHQGPDLAVPEEARLLVALRSRHGHQPEIFQASRPRWAKATICPSATSPARSTGRSAPRSRWGPTKSANGRRRPRTSRSKNQLPRGHSMHNHNLLPTFQVRIRDLDQWVTLIEHGGLTALDDVYVRALASRYGNPSAILRRDYVPALPGINAPGSYDELCAQSRRLLGRNGRQSIEDGHLPVLQAVIASANESGTT